MARVKRGFKARRRRTKILDLAKGFRGSRKNRFKTAVHVVRKALTYAYRDRKVKKREFRRLWITRINAAARANGLKYSQFMYGIKQKGLDLDRKSLAYIAFQDPAAFKNICTEAKSAIA
jgi:large subunit ribosomal protein L20